MSWFNLLSRQRFGMKAMQTQGFGSDKDHESSSGSIRDAGGAFSKREQAEEERFFRQKTREQLAALKKHHEDEIFHHKKEIERMEKEIERHKQKIKQLKHD